MRVSVIIPYKEDRGWLQKAIDSVPKEAELILSRGNGNCQQNFNNGIRKATGDIIRWLHEDDMLTENCIPDTIKTFEEQGCDWMHGNAYNLHDTGHGRIIPYIPPVKYPTLNELIGLNTIHGGTLAYRRDVFDRIGFMDEGLVWSEEFEYSLRCLSAGLKLGYCDKFLAYYRVHPGQKSNADQVDRAINRENIRDRYR